MAGSYPGINVSRGAPSLQVQRAETEMYNNLVNDSTPMGGLVIAGACVTALTTGALFLGESIAIISVPFAVLAGVGMFYAGHLQLEGKLNLRSIKAVAGKVTQGLKDVDWNQCGKHLKKSAWIGVPLVMAGGVFTPLWLVSMTVLAGYGIAGAGIVAGALIAKHF